MAGTTPQGNKNCCSHTTSLLLHRVCGSTSNRGTTAKEVNLIVPANKALFISSSESSSQDARLHTHPLNTFPLFFPGSFSFSFYFACVSFVSLFIAFRHFVRFLLPIYLRCQYIDTPKILPLSTLKSDLSFLVTTHSLFTNNLTLSQLMIALV